MSSGENIEVIVHIGAHKTATTYIQNILEANMDLLRKHGIAYVPLSKLRQDKFIQQLNKNTIKNKDDFINRYNVNTEGTKRLIISEENISGSSAELYNTGTLYAKLPENIKKIDKIFDGNTVKYLFCGRNYSGYISAMYIEYIRHKPYVSFKEFTGKINFETINWEKIIKSIQNSTKNEAIFWTYEYFRSDTQKIFEAITGINSINIAASVERRESVSSRAMVAINALSEVMDQHELKRIINAIPKILPRATEADRYEPIPKDKIDELEGAYNQHVSKIRQLNNVAVLG